MFQRQAPADWRSIVHDIDGISRHTQLVEQAIDQFAETVERIGELPTIWGIAFTVTGIIGRDHVIAIGKVRDQIAEHMRRGRKSVQQQHNRRVLGLGLSEEDVDPVDRVGPMMCDRERSGRGRVLRRRNDHLGSPRIKMTVADAPRGPSHHVPNDGPGYAILQRDPERNTQGPQGPRHTASAHPHGPTK